MLFDTKRSDLGELVYQFKYQHNYDKLKEIMKLIIPFLDTWSVIKSVNAILPVPSSRKDRVYQPAHEIAYQIAEYLGINCFDDVLQIATEVQAKGMTQEDKNINHIYVLVMTKTKG